MGEDMAKRAELINQVLRGVKTGLLADHNELIKVYGHDKGMEMANISTGIQLGIISEKTVMHFIRENIELLMKRRPPGI